MPEETNGNLDAHPTGVFLYSASWVSKNRAKDGHHYYINITQVGDQMPQVFFNDWLRGRQRRHQQAANHYLWISRNSTPGTVKSQRLKACEFLEEKLGIMPANPFPLN